MNHDSATVTALLRVCVEPMVIVRADGDTMDDLCFVDGNAAGRRWLAAGDGPIEGDRLVGATRRLGDRQLAAIRDAARSAGTARDPSTPRAVEADGLRLVIAPLPGRRAVVRVDRARQRPRLLAQVTSELEQFVHVVSHDLQAPLRAMSAYSELLARRYAGALDDRAGRYIEHIGDGARQMRSMTDDLLTFSRLAGQWVAPQPVDLDEVVERTTAALADRIAAASAAVRRTSLPAVEGVAALLERMVLELVDNALTFARPGVPPIVELAAERRADRWSLTIRDNGIGIAPRHHEAVFEPFRQLEPERAPGTGMGLAICRRIAGLHGGCIAIESTPGAGATVIVELPPAAIAEGA